VGFLIALLATLSLHTVMLSGFLTYAVGEWMLDRVAAGYGVSGGFQTMLDVLRGPAITLGLFAVLTVLYWALPTTRVQVVYAAAGALFATVAWTAITRGFGIYLLYLGQFSGTYGAFAAGIVLMVWMYGVSTVLLIGAEISAYPIRGRSTTR
jgi:membrane protein